MSAASLGRMLLMPRPARLAARLALGVAIPLVVVVVTIARGLHPSLACFAVLFATAQVSLAVTLTHKELMAAAPSFFQPGLRRRLAVAHVTWALGLALAVGLVGALLPGGGTMRALSLLGAALSVHALLAQLALRLSWGFQLPIWIWYAWFPIRNLEAAARTARAEEMLAAAWAWLPAGALLLALLVRTLAGPGLHRRLHGTLVLGLEDLFHWQRLQAYKHERQARSFAGQRGRGTPAPSRSRSAGACWRSGCSRPPAGGPGCSR